MSEFQGSENAVAPATPPAGYVSLYAKTDKQWYYKDDAGVEHSLRGGTGLPGGSTYDISSWISGVLTVSQVLQSTRIARGLSYPIGMAGSQASSTVAATASTVLSVQKNDVEFGTITFAAASSTGVFAAASAVTLVAGDRLSVVGPATPDTTLAGLSITLKGDGAVGAYDVAAGVIGLTSNGVTIASHIVSRGFSLPANLTSSQAVAQTAATASTVYSIQKNAVEFGTITFAAAGTVGTFVAASSATFVAGDILSIVAPTPADTTLADIDITLAGEF